MENNINSFFSDPDIGVGIKAISLTTLLNGTLEKYKNEQRESYCGSVGNSARIMIDKGIKDSYSGAVVGLLQKIVVSDYFKSNMARVLNGNSSDEEILKHCVEEIKERYNGNDLLVSENFKDRGQILGIGGKLKKFFNECKDCGDLSGNQYINAMNFVDLAEQVYSRQNDKKKQITAEMPSNN